jgi:hypothetical protein
MTAASSSSSPLIAIGPSRRSKRLAPRRRCRAADGHGWRVGGARKSKYVAGACGQVDVGVIRAARVEVQLADAGHRLGDACDGRDHVQQLVEIPARCRVRWPRPLPFPAPGAHRHEREVTGAIGQLVQKRDPSSVAPFEQPREHEVAQAPAQRRAAQTRRSRVQVGGAQRTVGQQERDLAHVLVGGERDRQRAGRAAPLGLRAPCLLPAAGLGGHLERRASGAGQLVVSLVRDGSAASVGRLSRQVLVGDELAVEQVTQPSHHQ